MKITKIIDRLEPKTINSALLFFRSPYFNKSDSIRVAFECLIHSHKQGSQISKGKLWSSIFPQKVYNDQLLRKLINQVTQKLELFFSVESLQSKEHLKLRTLADFSQINNISELKNKLQKTLDKSINARSLDYSEALFDNYTAKRSVKDIDGIFKRKKGYETGGEYMKIIQDLNAIIESSFVIEKLKLHLLQQNWLDIDLKIDKKVKISNFIDKQLKKQNKYNESGVAHLYILTYNYLKYETNQEFLDQIIEKLKILVLTNKNEANIVFTHIYNSIATKIGVGQDLFVEQYQLLNFGLDSKLLIDNDKIDPIDYRNIVINACRIAEFDWALDFIEKYKNYLDTESRQSAYSFSKARVFMNMRRYEDVIDVLQNVEYEDITYNINSRLMLIASFYELDEYDILESTIKAFKVFLRRKRNISVARKANFTDHCDVIYNLIKASERKDAKRIEKANDILSNNPGIPNKTWLKEKITEVSAVLGIKPEKTQSEDPTAQA